MTATAYALSYSNTNTDCFRDSNTIIHDMSGSERILTDLGEGTKYSITVTATLSGGRTKQDTITATTTAAGESTSQSPLPLLFSQPLTLTAPSAPPSSVRVSVESSTAITVQWGPVEPCDQQNGAITGYSVRYGEVGTSEGERSIEMASGDSVTTVSGLTKETVYTVEVAAETSGGTGVYSEPLTIETPDSECVSLAVASEIFTSSTDVYLSLNGEVIPNHGYVEISDIGSSDITALLCHTNRPPPPGGVISGGHWFAPDEDRVGVQGSTNVPGFERDRVPMLVRLRRSSGTPDEGIYRCDVNDAAETPQTVYVGLYNTGGGTICFVSHIYQWHNNNLFISLSINFSGEIAISTLDPTSDFNGDNPQFTLTCISTGGPATTVTWTRDSTTVTEGTETVLDDPETAQYTHTLTVTTAGEYTCSVANSAFSVTADITLEGTYYLTHTSLFSATKCSETSPPSGVTAVQNGLTSITVTWTASSDATGYRIHYTSDSDSGSEEVDAGATSLTLSGLDNGEIYSISIVATSPVLPTSFPIITEVTLC